MGPSSSFVSGLVLGSAATAALIYTWLRQDTADDTASGVRRWEVKKRLRSGDGTDKSAVGQALGVDPHSSFLTDIVAQLWSHLKIAAADMVQSTVEPCFAGMPSPMNTCRFTKVDLGNVPMKMDNIVVHKAVTDDGNNTIVQWDFDMEWDGECDIQLKADYIGTFGVRELKIFGRVSVFMKPLTNELPVVSGIQYAFINMPQIDLTFTGVASIAEMGVLNDSVRAAIQGSLLTSCLPHRRLYKVSRTNNFLDTYVPPVGVLRLTIESGSGFVTERRFLIADDHPDVYVTVTLGATMPNSTDSRWRTHTIVDEWNPVWNVQKDFLLWDRAQEINTHAWDEDGGPLDPDDDLGVANISVAELLLCPHRRKTLSLRTDKGLETGAKVQLSCTIGEWTTDLTSLDEASAFKAATIDDGQKEVKKSNGVASGPAVVGNICGLLVIIVNRAFNLPLDPKTASTFVKVRFGGSEYNSKLIYDYPGFWDPINPIYDSAFTIPLTSNMSHLGDDSEIEFQLINTTIAAEKSVIVGTTTVLLGDLKKHPQNTVTTKRRICDDNNSNRNGIGTSSALLEFRVSLSGVTRPRCDVNGGRNHDATSTLAPGTSSPTRALPLSPRVTTIKGASLCFEGGEFGTVRLTVVCGRGLTIQQQMFGVDIPDCYCVVYLGNDTFKTSVKHNTIHPSWNEYKDFPLCDHGQIVKLDVWDLDEDEGGFDVQLGSATTTVGKLLMAGGSTEMNIIKDGRSSGISISLLCDIVA